MRGIEEDIGREPDISALLLKEVSKQAELDLTGMSKSPMQPSSLGKSFPPGKCQTD